MRPHRGQGHHLVWQRTATMGLSSPRQKAAMLPSELAFQMPRSLLGSRHLSCRLDRFSALEYLKRSISPCCELLTTASTPQKFDARILQMSPAVRSPLPLIQMSSSCSSRVRGKGQACRMTHPPAQGLSKHAVGLGISRVADAVGAQVVAVKGGVWAVRVLGCWQAACP